MRSGVEARPTLERLSSRRDGDTMASSSGHTGSGCLHRLRLPPRSGSSFLSVSGDAPWLEQGPAELDQVAVHRRGSFTPRLGSLTTRLSERSRSVAKESKLAYNPRSWLETLDLLALHKKGAFLLVPCFLMTLWAVAITLVHAYWPETIGDLPVYVPTVLGSTMGVLLAFRLNTAYSRWWEGRHLWGDTLVAPRLLLTALRQRETTESQKLPPGFSAEANPAMRELGGWLIAFAVALKHHLRSQPIPLTHGHVPNRRQGRLSAAGRAASQSLPQQARRDALLEMTRAADGALSLLAPSQLYHLAQSKHPPLYALGRVHECIEACLEQRARRSWALEQLCYRQFEALAVALTGCERILRTPLPPGYVGVLRLIMLVWLILLPLSLLDAIPTATAPVTAFASYLLLEVEDVAVQVESPFGEDNNDLPLHVYVLSCQAEVHRLLDEGEARDDTAVGVGGAPSGGVLPAPSCGARDAAMMLAADGGGRVSSLEARPRGRWSWLAWYS